LEKPDAGRAAGTAAHGIGTNGTALKRKLSETVGKKSDRTSPAIAGEFIKKGNLTIV